ncbi:TonB-dependent receptor [Qipengyuania sphaerica]|uniref:TonB-dependent receptor n=1 Tax=Qipengyuania sphaerica TaxID=2867243 RepID=UPI001C878F17|nr:TonB-dependent siderophore receptor [Qipengyuania sphaerica]MBX7539832.1 TonB-dependent siderophore receptor [Qipengyuania sphaerica]
MKSLSTVAVLLAGTVFAPAALANTAAADAERDYLPKEIVVKGQRADDYGTDDGSSATKTPTPLIDVPQAVSFITEDQLEDQAVHQLGDALRYVPGISMETGEGHRDEVFIRGQESTADFYIDGLRDDAQYYRSLYNIERIEVLKGANALIFGRGAGGGAINRVAKRAEFQSAISGEASADSFGAFALLADVNQPVSDSLAMRLNATYEEFDNDRDFYEGRFIGISPTLTAALGPDTTLVASYTYDNDERVTDRGVPSLNGGPLTGYDSTFFGDPDINRFKAEVNIARLRLDHDFNGGLSANASVQFADYDKIYANILPTGTNGTTVSLSGYEDAQQRRNWIGQANGIWQAGSGNIESTFLFGVEASSQDSLNTRRTISFDDGDDTTVNDNVTALAETIFIPAYSFNTVSRANDSQLSTLSFYVQEQLQIGDHIELVGGLRWDRFDLETRDINAVAGNRIDEEFSPRAGLIVKPTPDLSIYASYAESFLPQAGDQFFLVSPGNAQFAPEKFTNYEIGAKWAPLDNVLVSAAIFRLERSNTRFTNELGITELTGESRTEGFEIGAVGEVTKFWKANLGYTYLDGELTSDSTFGDAGLRLQQLPRHSVSAWNRFDISDQIGFGLGVIHQSDQFASFSNEVVLPAYWRVDAAAYYTVSERLSLQLNIENLFDEDYYPSAHGDNNIQPGEPFQARIGVRFEI